MKKKYIAVSLLFIFANFLSSADSSPDYTKEQKLYSKVDRLSLRDKPGLKSKKIAYLGQGEEVVYLGKRSTFKTKYSLKGKEYNAYWYRIKKSTMEGWVYGGLVRPQPLAKNEIFWRAVVAVNLNKDYEGEDWGWFSNTVLESCYYSGVIPKYYTIRHPEKKGTVIIKQGRLKLATVNLGKALGKKSKDFMGYIFLQKGKKAEIVVHDQTASIIRAASMYYKINIKAYYP